MTILSSIIDDLVISHPNKLRPIIHIKKDYLFVRKDLWTRHGGLFPIPETDLFKVQDEGKILKIIPDLSRVLSQTLKPNFITQEVDERNNLALSSEVVYSSNNSPLTKARTQMAEHMLKKIEAHPRKSIHVEPVLNMKRHVHTLTLEEAIISLYSEEESKCDTFGQLVKERPRAELIFKLMSNALNKSVIFDSIYSTKVTFILYNAARIKQILMEYLHAFGSFPGHDEIHFHELREEGVLAISYLCKYPALLEEIRANGSIHNLPLFLTDFIVEFSRYYRNTRVLRDELHLRKLMDAKIHFLRSVLYLIHHILSIMNITCLTSWIEELCAEFLPSEID
uniref:DALR anticodon binding domain containing 3 [Chrysemys picta] n=1 Tax=Lepeophtheirus salmonis TaxID=72036 RepID=A0A0K2TRU3_LEPSM